MDIDKYLEPEFDFSKLDEIDLELLGDLKFDELIHAFRNPRTRVYDLPGYLPEDNLWYCVGFGDRSRCLRIMIHFGKKQKYVFLTFNVINEYEIEQLWCGA